MNVYQDGRDNFVKLTPMTAPRNRVFWEQIVLIWLQTLVAVVHQVLQGKDVKIKSTCVLEVLAKMEYVLTNCSIKNAYVVQDGQVCMRVENSEKKKYVIF